MSNREVVVLSVGGVRFVTQASTLQQFPESRLARMLNNDDWEFKLVNGEFFVDRDGTLFSYIMDFLRTLQVSLPTDFSDYQRLQREAEFYGLYPLADLLSQEHLLKPRLEILEVRFSLQEMQAFFRIFGSCSTTVETLAEQITVFTGQQSGQSWNSPFPSQKPLVPVPLERPSHHDMVFRCGTDYSAGDQFVARYSPQSDFSLWKCLCDFQFMKCALCASKACVKETIRQLSEIKEIDFLLSASLMLSFSSSEIPSLISVTLIFACSSAF